MSGEPPGPPRAHVEQVLEAAAALSRAVGPVERAAALEALGERVEAALRAPGGEAPRGAREALRGLFEGRAAALERGAAQVDRVLGAAHPALVEGEPGTGKTLVATAIHEAGRPGVLVRVARPAAPDALRRAWRAAPATLLCEEVATLSLAAQQELLRLLRAPGRRPPRVVATTRHGLDAAAAAGWFLPELRDRLHVLRLRLPPLREDPAAITALLQRRLRARGAPDEAPALTPEALAALRRHRWPGNVRELEEAARALREWAPRGPIEQAHVERFVAQLSPAAAPAGERPPVAPAGGPVTEPTLVALERATIAERLLRHGWRQLETARSLGIDRKTLYRKIREFGLEP
ncbi:MAG: sigma 54-interacting transcriptional regulator [Planctomycetes bacterium]|nr:sigma 54-interacting transcriptional regulator [Planctomycetota bacterium]